MLMVRGNLCPCLEIEIEMMHSKMCSFNCVFLILKIEIKKLRTQIYYFFFFLLIISKYGTFFFVLMLVKKERRGRDIYLKKENKNAHTTRYIICCFIFV